MSAHRHPWVWLLVAAGAAAGAPGCAAGSSADGPGGGMDATVSDAGADTGTAQDVPMATDAQDAPAPPPRCGDGTCSGGTENCMTCPLDCNQCPTCDMAPTCTGALAIPTASTPLAGCDNTTSAGTEQTNYACGTELGVAPAATTCADPQLRIRVQAITIQRGFFDIPKNMYCAITAEDGVHSELLLTTPRQVAGNRNTTTINLPLGQSVLWGQGDLYRSIANITITYGCYLASDGAAAQRVLDAIAARAGMAAEHADGYGWVFGTVAVLGTILGSSLGTLGDTQILDVQQTISAHALLPMTNGRTWEIRSQHGNLNLSGVWDLRLTVESWGCANVRVAAP